MKVNLNENRSISFTSYYNREYVLSKIRHLGIQWQTEAEQDCFVNDLLRMHIKGDSEDAIEVYAEKFAKTHRLNLDLLAEIADKKANFKTGMKNIMSKVQKKLSELPSVDDILKTLPNNSNNDKFIPTDGIYPDVGDKFSSDVAKNVLGFTAETVFNSPHNLDEFFAPEEVAAELRKKLSPECQGVSQEFRALFQQLPISKDPIMSLISANELKNCMPKKGALTQEQYTNIANSAKNAYLQMLNKIDLSNFKEEQIIVIKKLKNIMVDTEGVDFGPEFSNNLQKLIDDLNGKNSVQSPVEKKVESLRTFIPPVIVKERDKY